MAELPPTPPPVWAVYALLLCIALYVYGLVVRRIARQGGRVNPEGFALPELLMTFVIGGFFVVNTAAAFIKPAKTAEKAAIEEVLPDKPEKPVEKTDRDQPDKPDAEKITVDKVLPGALVYVVISVGIICFLHFSRQIPVGRIFGFSAVPLFEMMGWIAGLFLAVLPIVGAVNMTTQAVMKGTFELQPLVKLFTQMAREGNHSAVAKIVFVGTIVAPCCEEFLFRGFFYRTWKRYLGPLGAGFVASALFAALHGSVPALAGLFVLACLLTIAYERTGSLLVPIGMHACFNFTSLSLLYFQARYLPALPT